MRRPAVRIAFLVHWRSGRTSGIYTKVAAQAAAWVAAGHEVGLFVATSETAVADWQALPSTQEVLVRSAGPGGKLLAREAVAAAARRWHPDVVYVRHGLAHPGLLRLARALPLVIEVNGDDLVELPLVAPSQVRYARATRGALLRRAAGLVFVTHELSRRPGFARYGRPHLVLPNGIDLAGLPVLERAVSGPPALAMVGHPGTPWHGAEELVALARVRPDWRVHLVGPTAADLGEALPANVLVHGILDPSGVHEVLRQVDVGVGSLSLHRAGLAEACVLKVRESLALGLPVVLGHVDADFPGGAPFLLQVPNRPGGISAEVDRVEAFVTSWRGRTVQRADVAVLDTAAKEEQRLAFLRGLLR